MNTLTISHLVGSSEYRAIADDTLKDEDNAAWIVELDPEIRKEWVERIRWIRLADRLAESELFNAERSEFQWFYDSWRWLRETGQVQPGCSHAKVFYQIRDRWFSDFSDPTTHLCIRSWDQYLKALVKYHKKHLVINSFHDFEEMLEQLAAPFFQVLPFLSEHQWQAAGQFGAIDQFYNNLRDLREDAEQGICYLPTELLDRFGVSREEVLTLRATENLGYRPMMEFWVHDYLPQLYRKTYPFILSPDLHPSWQMLRDWSLHRYQRIERVFRRCDYDYLRFPKLYWRDVKKDLALLLPEVSAQTSMQTGHTPSNRVSRWGRSSKLFQISQLPRSSEEPKTRQPFNLPSIYTYTAG
ncbi:MAG: squalene/phytoene synthase family protein [Leptolyngbyaceae cyanobacterium CSU_1_3]|nr:squalene/phytoene synthase family protein [Leptolyngbyaceae cyanobacterium CSU_1_3]